MNKKMILTYFKEFEVDNNNYTEFEAYFLNFYNFCFEIPLDNMLRETINFKI